MSGEIKNEGPLRFVVATERSVKGKVPSALSRLIGIRGIDILGSTNPDRVLVRAHLGDIEKLALRYPDTIFVEPEIMYDKN